MAKKAHTPKILVIEDEPTQRKIVQGHLVKMGLTVLTAENGQEGISLWEKDKDIRIVITDFEMPQMDGRAVVSHIRNSERKYTYVMVLTTLKDKQSLLDCLQAGADDFVNKPIIKQELELRMKGALRRLRLADHDKLVIALSEMVALRSGELDSHLKRTRDYCSVLANDLMENHPELGLTQQNVEDIANISVLHDIGQIHIPEGLLYKRGRYSDKEYAIIKDHTSMGAETLRQLSEENSSEFLHIGYEIVLGHHEKWDGNGYPKGLKGDDIPLPARIMAFADAFDALLSRRSYKDAYSLSHADRIIESEKGKHFDPMVVEAYERNKETFFEIHKKYPEPKSNW